MKFPDTEGSMDGKNYLKLKDKESVRGVFRGDPYLFRLHWQGQKSTVCTGDQHCAHCKAGEKSTFRFKINFIVKENETFVPKIWEQGWTVYSQLKSLNEDYDLEKTTVKVSRSGSGKNDTSYTVLPLPNGTVSAETLTKLTSIQLHDLSVFQSPEEKVPAQDSPFDEDIPF